jgi:hypothetical protein
MRRLTKGPAPQILVDNFATWTAEFLADKKNDDKKFKYRHPTIKASVLEETFEKCCYCESKVRAVAPGHTEHKLPSSKFPELIFEWTNLTFVCEECNRRKRDYHSDERPFLDPYTDDVEARVLHDGPVAYFSPADTSAEISVTTLGLDSWDRKDVIEQKCEKISAINDIAKRLHLEQGTEMAPLLKAKLAQMSQPNAEYSAMVLSILASRGLL